MKMLQIKRKITHFIRIDSIRMQSDVKELCAKQKCAIANDDGYLNELQASVYGFDLV